MTTISVEHLFRERLNAIVERYLPDRFGVDVHGDSGFPNDNALFKAHPDLFDQEHFSEDWDQWSAAIEGFNRSTWSGRWEHQATLRDAHETFASYRFQNLEEGAAIYLQHSKLKSPLFDWYLADAAIFQAFQWQLDALQSLAHPMLHKATTLKRPILALLAGISLRAIAWVLAALVLLGLLALAVQTTKTTIQLIALAAASALVLHLWRKRARERRSREVAIQPILQRLDTLERLNKLTATQRIAWDVLADELRSSRLEGIAWPSFIFELTQSRREQRSCGVEGLRGPAPAYEPFDL